MNKAWILLAAVLMLACACPSLPILGAKDTHNQPTPALPATWTPATESLSTGDDFSLVRLYTMDGNLADQLGGEAAKARSLGQQLFVEFDASW